MASLGQSCPPAARSHHQGAWRNGSDTDVGHSSLASLSPTGIVSMSYIVDLVSSVSSGGRSNSIALARPPITDHSGRLRMGVSGSSGPVQSRARCCVRTSMERVAVRRRAGVWSMQPVPERCITQTMATFSTQNPQLIRLLSDGTLHARLTVVGISGVHIRVRPANMPPRR